MSHKLRSNSPQKYFLVKLGYWTCSCLNKKALQTAFLYTPHTTCSAVLNWDVHYNWSCRFLVFFTDITCHCISCNLFNWLSLAVLEEYCRHAVHMDILWNYTTFKMTTLRLKKRTCPWKRPHMATNSLGDLGPVAMSQHNLPRRVVVKIKWEPWLLKLLRGKVGFKKSKPVGLPGIAELQHPPSLTICHAGGHTDGCWSQTTEPHSRGHIPVVGGQPEAKGGTAVNANVTSVQ